MNAYHDKQTGQASRSYKSDKQEIYLDESKFKHTEQSWDFKSHPNSLSQQVNDSMKEYYENNSSLLDESSERISYRFKLILLGDVSVGKTCLALKFVKDEFRDEYSCTVGVEFKIKTIYIGSNTTADLQVWDTCGQERFRTITRQYYRDANGILLVFDVTNKKSFNDLETWLDDIKSYAQENRCVLLVGNKADLKAQRVIDVSRAMNFAAKHGIGYVEVSAKEGHNVYYAFEKVARELIRSDFKVSPMCYTPTNEESRVYLNKKLYKNKEERKGCC